MNKNNKNFGSKKSELDNSSYVTGALFIVFAILTVIYMGYDEPDQSVSSQNPAPGINTVLNETSPHEDDDANDADDESSVTESSVIENLRVDLEVEASKKVAELEAVVASAEVDETEKNEAKQELETMNSNAESAAALEAMILSKGYEDVLVRVGEDTVQVIVGIADETVQPTVEQTNEVYILAKNEFTNDSFVTVSFEPIK